MCGIVGLFDTLGLANIPTDLLETMNASQSHRGPDGDGLHIEPGVGLGHRRLSIIDIASGKQPLFNEDDSVAVTFNGEIYNFVELMEELKKRGHVFKTRCDTEVIVHAWEEWGESCVDYFRGMFAFAVWDRNQQQLFLARDRLGIKPLFYTILNDGVLAFSSELKALKHLPNIDRTLDPTGIEDYFSLGYIPEPKTIYKQVKKLRPGHSLLIERGKVVQPTKEYWDVSCTPLETRSAESLQDELVERIQEAIKIRMIAEVPLGAFLSGGVDSGSVVAMMAKMSDTPVNTCSIGFDVQSFDETHYANMVAERYQTNHFEGTVASDDFGLLDQLAQIYDEPYADSSAIPTYRVCELAKTKVTVALSGDGGDEHLAGYRRYNWHMNEERFRSRVPLGVRKGVFGPLGKLYPKADWAPKMFRAKTTFEALARGSVEAYYHTVSLTTPLQREQLFSDSYKKDIQGYRTQSVFEQYASKAPTDDPLSLIQYLDMKTYLVGDILTKVDRASMAHALEVRVPLLDHKLVDWISGLPSELKLKDQCGKYILKKAMEPYLPHDVLYRKKMGFAVPLAEWFRGPLQPLLKTRLLQGIMADCGYFNLAAIEKIIQQHVSKIRDHSTLIWTLFMFEAFLRGEAGLGFEKSKPVIETRLAPDGNGSRAVSA
ncbi:amidotransferase 1, exosortase A system-associated [Aestuariicella hydrocarbonica]|uniref:asparagine synthase (glutamine-hydrolyzing) n=1 Tax=Pseudomaricurvus hydrocarbonicus TaxID=1470433 RepID=A0A9E5JUC1_9GAMM|nr:XrtA/PEP-CTERM system amidotransferase [Aestuariicella hydrocarbonica]NHO64691.1 amidotransferase 1, exosortase A system-associated [Aestuariicella hydrocarbonica]